MDAALEGSAQGIRGREDQPGRADLDRQAQALVVMMSGSVALLADTVHNIADALTAVPLWIAFLLSRRPATRRYTPMGTGGPRIWPACSSWR